MEGLSEESKKLHEILKAETTEEYETRFLEHKKDILDTVHHFINDANKQFKEAGENLESVEARLGAEITGVRDGLGGKLEAAQSALSSDIAKLTESVDRIIRSVPTTAADGTPTPHT